MVSTYILDDQYLNNKYKQFHLILGGTIQSEGKSVLTQNKLKEHDNITNSCGFNKSKPDDVMSHTSASTYKTFETFASDWSSCTNPSFNR